MYQTITDLPPEVRDSLTPDEQAHWLAVFNTVLEQTGDEEKARLAAWGAVRKGRVAVRAVSLQQDGERVTVRGWGMKFSDAADPDFYGEHFSTLTHLLADYYRDAPLWYEHGMDPAYGYMPIGRRTAVEIYGFGVWAEHELFTDHPLFERTLAEITSGVLSYSSDSLAHYWQQGLNPASGEIRMWPLAGWSLTRQPAEDGLGPVTLAGMEAVIREVVEAPAKRVPLERGTVLTLTACKSVYAPVPDSEAREAQGASEPDNSHPEPTDNHSERGDTMDPETLAALADFLGVEATPDAVLAALQALIAQLEGSVQPAAAESAPDGSALRAALQLEAAATDDDVAARLRDLLQVLVAPEPEPEASAAAATRSYNYAALGTALRHAQTMGNPPMPFYVSSEDGDFDADDDPPPAPRAARSRSLHAPRINTGRAPKPGLVDAIFAGLGYHPPSFRRDAPLGAIKARLFQLDRAAKAQGSDDGPRGAYVLNRELAADILEPLTSALVLFQAGAFRWPMDGIDSLTIRKQVGIPGAYWAAENTALDGDEARWALATLTLKELRAPTTWPNRWLRNLAPGAETMIRDSIVKAMRLKMEHSALFGNGAVPNDGRSTGPQPLGVRWTPGVAVTEFSPARTPGIADLEIAQGSLEDSDVEESNTWGWVSHPRTFRTFEYMRDGNDNPVMRDSWMDGVRERTLVDYPYFKTTGVPKSLGAGGNESVLFFGDWQELVVGMGMDVELLVSDQRYIEKNQTFVMGVAYVDTGVMYPEAFHVHTGVLK